MLHGHRVAFSTQASTVMVRQRFSDCLNFYSGCDDLCPVSFSLKGPYDVLEFTFDVVDDGGVCRETIQDAYEEIVELVLTHQGAELADRLNLCNPVETDNPSDVAALYENSIRAVMYYFEDFQ